jgi:hypothetical protein
MTTEQYIRDGAAFYQMNDRSKMIHVVMDEERRSSYAALLRELDTAIAPHGHIKFTSVHAHSGKMLNECAGQLATRAETMVPRGEQESEEEVVMEEADITQRDDWNDPEHLPRGGTHVASAGLAAEELRKQQEELLQRFSQEPVLVVSDNSVRASPHASPEESDGDAAIPDPDDGGVAHAISGDGLRIIDDDPPTWTVPQFPFYEHVTVSNRVRVSRS